MGDPFSSLFSSLDRLAPSDLAEIVAVWSEEPPDGIRSAIVAIARASIGCL